MRKGVTVADIADIANDNAQLFLDAQLAARKPSGGVVQAECDDCGGSIPEERRQALAGHGCLRCVGCQTFHEARGGGR